MYVTTARHMCEPSDDSITAAVRELLLLVLLLVLAIQEH